MTVSRLNRAASVCIKPEALWGFRLFSYYTLTLSVIVSLLRKANNLDDHNQNAADGNDCLCVHGLTSFPEAARTDGTPAHILARNPYQIPKGEPSQT